MKSPTSLLTLPCRLAVAWAVIRLAGVAFAQEAGNPRAVLIEEVRNNTPAFMVRVEVDRADRTYRGGEQMHVRVVSEKAGYLYLLYCDAGGNITCLLPNSLEQTNHIPAGQPVQVPWPGAPFRLTIGAPYGQEALKAIVSLTPLEREQLRSWFGQRSVGERLRGVKTVSDGMKSHPTDWAEHDLTTMTLPPVEGIPSTPQPAPGSGSRRVGVFVGVSEYLDPQIRRLKTPHQDAAALADVMRRTCRLDEAVVLVNSQATLARIEQTLRRHLRVATRPGDTVILFWSGHGGRCADDNGDEKDGFDGYLVPYDGRLGDEPTVRRTMVIDDTFGRWIQELDGRRIVVILDACYSGGQAAEAKGLTTGRLTREPGVFFDFFEGVLERAKDLGQKELALLASSRADQISFERREGDRGVLNYFLIQQLTTASGPLTLSQAFDGLKGQVAAYVERQFPGGTQTPLLIEHLTPPFYLRP